MHVLLGACLSATFFNLIPKTKFLNFERRKIEFLDEILVKKHDFGVNFSVLASKF